ncbi:MAG TPA: hypothetical protein VF944_10555 [Candidatus Bathyarchaeia archaeon]
MSKEQFDLFEQPPPHLARGHSAEQVSINPWKPPRDGHPLYLAAQELIHFTAYLKLSDWQQKYLWPHMTSLLDKMRKAESDHVRWFELGYIVSAMEVEQIRSRSAAAEICKKYGVELPQ